VSAPACDPAGRCITCSDEAVPMRVVWVHDDSALCEDAEGARHEVAIELLQLVSAGDEVLVHAGVAIR
jgi:hydrogenase expression/formation protein HypC